MAEITRTHGNAFGSVSHDRGTSSTGNISADELVTINGPVCNYFKIIIQDVSGDVNDLRPELGTGEVVEAVIKEINSKANVEAISSEKARSTERRTLSTPTIRGEPRLAPTIVPGNLEHIIPIPKDPSI